MTLVEILLALAILAVIAAVVYPTAMVQLRRGHSTALANQLVNLRDAIASFRENVGAYPISLAQLATAPVAGDNDSCAAALSNAERNAWRGPYVNQTIGATLPVGEATVQAALTRLPATTATTPVGMLQIRALGVEADVATELEARFDGNADFASGTVLWTLAGGGTLTFQIPIRGC